MIVCYFTLHQGNVWYFNCSFMCVHYGFLKDFEDGVCDFKLTHE
jgi:hypothetical protein